MKHIMAILVLMTMVWVVSPLAAQEGCVPPDSEAAQREGAIICQVEPRANITFGDEDDDDSDDEGIVGTDDEDTIIVEDDAEVESDGVGVDAGGGDDVIIIYGDVESEEEGIDAGDGDDRILIEGNIDSDDEDDIAVDAGDGDDRITVQDDAEIDGIIDGGDGFDRLTLDVDVDEDDYDDVKDELEDAGSSGCVDISGREYCWRSIEELNSILTIVRRQARNYTQENAASFSERLNGQQLTAPVALFCEVNGSISVWDIGANGQGTLAFTIDPTLALLTAITDGVPVVAAQALGNQLIALPDDQLQVIDEAGYNFTFPAGACFAR